MRIGPWLVLRGVVTVVIFILAASFALTHATPGAAEEVNRTDLRVQIDPTCKISQLYPAEVRQWCRLIVKFSNQHQFDPDLIAGLIWYESGGKASAYSRSGAVGLMQVMPRDGLAAEFMCPNGPCFANRPSRNELENPEFNIEYGTRMLSGLLKRNQDLREALKSYGPAGAGYTYADKVLAIYESYRAE